MVSYQLDFMTGGWGLCELESNQRYGSLNYCLMYVQEVLLERRYRPDMYIIEPDPIKKNHTPLALKSS